tara:strand:+ start:3309 stop:4238 length:930 start_codon:yes stop_codon:yes gene_type:complete
MRINKPQFWQHPGSIGSLILLPITLIVLTVIFFKKKFSKEKKFSIPIICIGNIYLGGTGKTPLSILICEELRSLNKSPVIIKKFYENQNDERLLIKNRNIPLISEKRRDQAILKAINNYDLAVLDDGFQDYNIRKDMNILCFHENQLLGNEQVFPSGPLRESINSIKRAQAVIINGKKNLKFENKLLNIKENIKIFYSRYNILNQQIYKNKNILAFAGIGNPKNFFGLLTSNGFNLKDTISFPDHYEFKKREIEKIVKKAQNNDYTILTTEKDYLRIAKYDFEEINFCKVNLEIIQKEKFLKFITEVYD